MREEPAHPYLYVACWEKNSNNKKESKVKTEKAEPKELPAYMLDCQLTIPVSSQASDLRLYRLCEKQTLVRRKTERLGG